MGGEGRGGKGRGQGEERGGRGRGVEEKGGEGGEKEGSKWKETEEKIEKRTIPIALVRHNYTYVV